MIRPAVEGDVDELVGLIHDLAEYERSPSSVEVVPDQLRNALFGASPAVFALVAEEDSRLMGMAIWFLNFSTWTGRHGIYLEDLYVRPEGRGRGVGRDLVEALATLAVEAGYARVDWAVLDWNAPAIGFYESLGAVPMDEWTGYRLTGEALAALGSTHPRAE